MAQYIYSMYRVSKVVPPKRTILKDISLSFFPGAKIGVLGLNGAGKSTLLRIMAGVDTEFEGEARPLAGTKIGYLPQEPVLDASKTVREIVEEAVSDVKGALTRLDEVYAAYADENADFDAITWITPWSVLRMHCAYRRGMQKLNIYRVVSAAVLRFAGCY